MGAPEDGEGAVPIDQDVLYYEPGSNPLKVAFSLYECFWTMLLLHPGGKPLNPQHYPC